MIVELGNLVHVQPGHPFRGSVPEAAAGDASVLQMRDISPDGVADWEGLVRTSLARHRNPGWLQSGDVVFVARGLQNYALCLDGVPSSVVCAPYFFLLRVQATSLAPGFLAWQINRSPAQQYLTQNAEGSNKLSIRRGVLEKLPIVVPPLEQQHRIVDLARAANRERQVLEALIRNREQQLDALAFDLHRR